MRRKSKKRINWNKKIAYIVGLITTDGNLSKDLRHICLTSTDIQLLNTYKICLHTKNKIIFNSPGSISKSKAYKVNISDVCLYDFLLKIGLFPKKSLTLGTLKIPKNYFRDFLRGHLDGDGSIIYFKDYYNTYKNPKYVYDRLFVYLISASIMHIKWLQKKIIELTQFKGNLETLKSGFSSNQYYRIKYSTKEAKKLLNWIYYKPGLPCLLRKYNIAKPFLSKI